MLLTIVLTICCSAAAAVIGALLGSRVANELTKRELQTTRDDLDHLATRFERELKVRAANKSVEKRQDHLAHAAEIVAQTQAEGVAIKNSHPTWGRVRR